MFFVDVLGSVTYIAVIALMTNLYLSHFSTFSAIQGKKILIHGGGSIATKHAQLLNIQQHFHEGRRIAR
jgi:acetylglutamate kinase